MVQLVPVPVSDPDRTKAFYEQLGAEFQRGLDQIGRTRAAKQVD